MKTKRAENVFDVDLLLNLLYPTVRVPMHASPDGSMLSMTAQS